MAMSRRFIRATAQAEDVLGQDVLDFRSSTLIDSLANAASAAGSAILRHYGVARPKPKSDGSPVTAADEEADAILADALARLLPGVPVLSEERASSFEATDFDAFVLVDPLDGTKEFLAGNGDFTVNIAIVVNGAPVTGIVYAPVRSALWTGGAEAQAATLQPGAVMAKAEDRRSIRVRRPSPRLAAIMSRTHPDADTEAFLARLGASDVRHAGSSLKFCMLAQGDVDIYPRFGPTMEWDTAAGHAIVVAAGGVVLTPEGEPFLYAKAEQGYRNGPFVAAATRELIIRAAA
jgi:3'(2'), 5'-bisphosphate nucleotidase